MDRQTGAIPPGAALALSPEEIAVYRDTARRRLEREQEEAAPRRERAWEVARRAASLLKGRFGATRVVVFGSLVRPGGFTRWSDVDLAAWGLRPEDTFRAIGAVLDLDPEIEVNLVDVDACSPSLCAAIGQDGIEL